MTEDERAKKLKRFNTKSARWRAHIEVAQEFSSPLLRKALSVWRAKAGRNPWPRREDMSPRAMKDFLPHVAILEPVTLADKTRYRARLTGTWFDQRVAPMQGKFIDEVIPSPYAEQFQSMFDFVLDIGEPIRCLVNGLKFQDKEYLEVEDFFAPLGNPREPPNAILAVISSKPRSP